jgi:hypothetical protein
MMNDSIAQLIAQLPIIDPNSFTAKDLPKNGIYLLYERSEGPRIVRVGTHKAEAGLYTRLRKHFGTRNSSRAWRRTSVFRLHVGGALLNRDQDPRIQEWSERQGERLPEVEAMVTEQLLTTFAFRAIQVDSLEERLSLERDLIATLSATPEMTPEWLGQYAVSSRIRESGLWNSDHVGAQERVDLDRLQALVAATS